MAELVFVVVFNINTHMSRKELTKCK